MTFLAMRMSMERVSRMEWFDGHRCRIGGEIHNVSRSRDEVDKARIAPRNGIHKRAQSRSGQEEASALFP